MSSANAQEKRPDIIEDDVKDVKEQEPGDLTVSVVDAEADTDADKEVISHDEFTEDEYKRLRRKMDLILMPMLMILYGLQYSDKISLSSGVIFGLKEDTHLTPAEYPNLTSFFYMSYAVAQYPMAFMLQRFPLGRALGCCIVLWGTVVMCLGACNTYAELSVCRVLLGWFESVVTPGFAIFTASWYLRREQTLRQNMYYSMNTFFAMIFGVGIYFIALDAQKRGGLAAWRVINLFLGGVTVGMGFLFLVFGGTPDEVWWLSKREKRMAKARIVSNATGGGEQHPWRWEQVRECFRDAQWWHAVIFNLIGNFSNGALTTFTSLIFMSFGFTNLQAILYGLPQYAISFVLILVCAFTVYYFPAMRFPLCLFTLSLQTFVLLFVGLADVGKWARWAVFLFSGMDSISTFLVPWPMISLNVAGRTKKAFFGASSLLAYCVGNLIGAQIMRPSDAPKYHTGLTVAAVSSIVTIINTLAWWWHYVRANKRRDAEFASISEEEREHQAMLNGQLDLTDCQNRQFRYVC